MRYNKMIELFRNTIHDDRQWDQSSGGCICSTKHDTSKPDARLVVPVRTIVSRDARIPALFSEPNLGVDLPTWFCANNQKKAKRVMLVSQDPLRIGDDAGSLYISSPWAFHSKEFRTKEKNNIPKLLVDHLLEHGYCVYLTDASKLFARDHEYCHDVVIPSFRKDFQEILLQEIKMLNPDVIVAIGKTAAQILTGNSLDDWNNMTLPKSSTVNVRAAGKEYKCLLAYHYRRLSAHKKILERYYDFADNFGNRNYVQYYMSGINELIC